VPTPPPGSLRRQLGLGSAVVVGAGSMVGAGVFTAWSPAAAAAGTGLLVGLVVAAVVAFANATSSARLAAVHPESGGTYVYARRQLSPAWGHLAGWGFVVGKIASCAAMALTAGAYLGPGQPRLVAVGAVVVVTGVNLGGLSRTVALTVAVLAITTPILLAVVGAGWRGPAASLERLTPVDASAGEVLRAAGFLFFAFAGYARIATLGEEVRDPARTIPRAIPLALGAVLALYALVAVTLLAVVPVADVAASDVPLRLVVDASGASWLAPFLRVGAGVATFGVLLNLVPGVSRTVLAMARRRELPARLALVSTSRALPVRAELAVAAVVVVLVVVVDLRGAIGFSSVTILTYYALANASALTLPARRRGAGALALLGLVGCVVLALALPLASLLTGAGVLAAGAAVRWVTGRARSRRHASHVSPS
jgi:APA family basic amino acid/polyamine antiporter